MAMAHAFRDPLSAVPALRYVCVARCIAVLILQHRNAAPMRNLRPFMLSRVGSGMYVVPFEDPIGLFRYRDLTFCLKQRNSQGARSACRQGPSITLMGDAGK